MLPSSDYGDDILNRPLAAAYAMPGETGFTLEFEDGGKAVFAVEGDCCSRSWIESVECYARVEGAVIIEVLQDYMGGEQDDEHDWLQSYATRFRTPRGDIVVEYRNSSNGYYGGYMVREL